MKKSGGAFPAEWRAAASPFRVEPATVVLRSSGLAPGDGPSVSLAVHEAFLQGVLTLTPLLVTAPRSSPPKETAPTVDLYEYQGKQYFARFGIPTSPGGVADTVDEAVEQAESAGYPVVVKAQVKVGGRGKAGGVKLAADADEVRLHAGNILGLDIKGHVVKRLWIEHASDIAKEYYASFTLDRPAKLHLGMLSAEGGVEIEEVAETNPDAIAKIHIDPVAGLSEE